jgi:hypothetical protein
MAKQVFRPLSFPRPRANVYRALLFEAHMGLDAVVFRSVRHLEEEFGKGLFDVDQSTGEAMLRPGAAVSIPRERYFAAQERLGNAASIGALREIARSSLGGQATLLVDRVLSSGSHSGDSILVEELQQLDGEICQLENQGDTAPPEFLGALRALMHAARFEKNPIVFV